MRPLHLTALVLTIIGAINWGLIGLFDFNLVGAIFGGPTSTLARLIYTLVGIAGVILSFTATDRRMALRDQVPHIRRAA